VSGRFPRSPGGGEPSPEDRGGGVGVKLSARFNLETDRPREIVGAISPQVAGEVSLDVTVDLVGGCNKLV
jgi:hypothetical protein